ncbi:hypothetical protein F0562_031847 [Nyssa sinensis]|uniref:Uncharacterized protein n=1 Tax=Nyssa sinensis TaxID=561372 RepID=A0A5J5AWZ0_9ASTE|nr:hypothetical protein F0562_031847 [Nyssa sinensis]
MASSTSSLFPLSYCPAITNEEFNLFHSIDRELYSLLILNLGRDPAESMHVMALWLWVEKAGHDHRLVKKMLLLPATLLNALADETVTCLKCTENDEFPFDHNLEGNDISTLQTLIQSDIISLRYFHENRISVLRGVTKIVNEVCARAFEDILSHSTFQRNPILMGFNEAVRSSIFENNRENVKMALGGGGYGYYNPVITSVSFCPGIGVVSEMGFNVAPFWPNHGSTSGKFNGVPSNLVPAVTVHTYDPYDLAMQRQFLNNELGDLLSRINLEPDEQVLYARLVARSSSIIGVVLDGHSKAKFSINGKHVWARKYVKKHPKSPQQVTSPPQPASPVAVPQP